MAEFVSVLDATWITILIYAGINVVGLVWSAGIIAVGIPARMSIQGRHQKWASLLERLPLIVFNQLTLIAVVWLAMSHLGHHLETSLPLLWVLVLQVFMITFIDDAWFYAWHRLLHQNKGLYNRIHRIHHRAHAPLPIEYMYVHPLEWMVGSVGPALGLAAVAMAWGEVSTWTLWGYLLTRNLHELDIHSGMRSPVGELIPLYASTEHHDLHHSRPTMGNYASTFEVWDRLMKSFWRPQ